MIKMEEPPPLLSPSPSPPSFDQFRIRRRGLSNSTLTCLSVVVATAVIIACFLPIHPVNASSCKVEPEEGVEINETLIGMLNKIFKKKHTQNKTFFAAVLNNQFYTRKKTYTLHEYRHMHKTNKQTNEHTINSNTFTKTRLLLFFLDFRFCMIDERVNRTILKN